MFVKRSNENKNSTLIEVERIESVKLLIQIRILRGRKTINAIHFEEI